MAREKESNSERNDKPQDNSQKSGSRRGRRRRYYRNKRRKGKTPSGGDAQQQSAAPGQKQTPEKGVQRDRRERRRRRRRKTKQQEDVASERSAPSDETDVDMPAPKDVFVYTYVVRPQVRESYEFRPDHFSKVSRRLEDFSIDLSPLFTETGILSDAAKESDAVEAGIGSDDVEEADD